jgi:hypothetical protein
MPGDVFFDEVDLDATGVVYTLVDSEDKVERVKTIMK